MKQVVKTNNAPVAIGPYSQAVKAGNTIYISGQLPIVPATGEFASNDIATMNDIYAGYFQVDCPARAAFAVKDLPKGALVEIECIAYKE